MKRMHKISMLVILLVTTLIIMGCSINSVAKLEFVETPDNEYVLTFDSSGKANEGTVAAKIRITYTDGSKSSDFTLNNASSYGVKVTGDKYVVTGVHTLRVSYGSIAISHEYLVVTIGEEFYSLDELYAKYSVKYSTNADYDPTGIVEETTDKVIPDSAQRVKNSTILNNLVAFAIQEGYNVQFPNKKYYVGKTSSINNGSRGAILLNGNIKIKGTIEGDSKTEFINYANAAEAIFCIGPKSNETLAQYTTVEIADLKLNGDITGLNFYDRYGINVSKDKNDLINIVVDNCDLNGFKYGFIQESGSATTGPIQAESIIIKNSKFTNINSKAIYIESANYLTIKNNEFNNCLGSEIQGKGAGDASACIIDVGFRRCNFEKLEITNNNFINNEIPSLGKADFQRTSHTIIMIDLKEGGPTGQKIRGTVKEIIILNNDFTNNFINSIKKEDKIKVTNGIALLKIGDMGEAMLNITGNSTTGTIFNEYNPADGVTNKIFCLIYNGVGYKTFTPQN